MQLKKSIQHSLMALAALCVPMAFTACSSDEFVTKLDVDDNLVATGISAEIDGLVTTLGITSNDSWTVSIPEEAEEWIYLPTTSGTGNSEVLVSIDANIGSAESRSTTLTIKAGDQTCKVPVIQRPTYQGEAVANGEELANQIQIAINKGLGIGYNVNKFEPMKKNIINLPAVKKLLAADDIYDYLFTYDAVANAQAEGAVIDSVETKTDSLGVALSFDITYGKFKMNIGGAYHGYENKTNLSDAFHYGGTYNVAAASIDLASISALYEDPDNNAMDDTQIPLMKALFTPGFKKAKQYVDTACAGTENNQNDLNSAISALVNDYGMAVVSECRLGGDIAFDIKFEVDTTGSTMRVDSAHVKVAIETGLLKLNAGVEVSYKKEATDLLKKGAFKYDISGGSGDAVTALTKALTDIRKENDTVDSAVHDRIDKWIKSINADKKETMSYTKLTIYPIWELFSNIKARNAVQEWIKNNYPKAYETFGIKDNNVVNDKDKGTN